MPVKLLSRRTFLKGHGASAATVGLVPITALAASEAACVLGVVLEVKRGQQRRRSVTESEATSSGRGPNEQGVWQAADARCGLKCFPRPGTDVVFATWN